MHLGDVDLRSRSFPYRPRYARSRHGRVAYFDEGQGEALVFVHGLVGDFTHFEHVAPAFAEGHRVVGLDLPGCGLSDKLLHPHSLDSHTDALVDLLDHLGLARATLVGHSAGGQVCAQVALRAPSRVARLVLINAAGLRGYPRVAHVAARRLIRPWLLPWALERAAMPLIHRVFHQSNAFTEKFVKDSIDRPPHPILEEMAKVMSDLIPDLMRPTVRDGAARLTMPSLVIWGEQDRLVPLADVRAVASSLPAGRLEVIAGCGHMPTIEHPGVVMDLMRRFLADHAASRRAA